LPGAAGGRVAAAYPPGIGGAALVPPAVRSGGRKTKNARGMAVSGREEGEGGVESCRARGRAVTARNMPRAGSSRLARPGRNGASLGQRPCKLPPPVYPGPLRPESVIMPSHKANFNRKPQVFPRLNATLPAKPGSGGGGRNCGKCHACMLL
jgi:hypothetical protein